MKRGVEGAAGGLVMMTRFLRLLLNVFLQIFGSEDLYKLVKVVLL